MKLSIIFLSVLTLFTNQVLSQICPPKESFPSECSCYDGNMKRIECLDIYARPPQPWNIKRTFDNIADLVKNKTVVFDELQFTRLSLLNTPIVIPDNTVANLKFKAINIFSSDIISGIGANAFSGTYAYTELFQLTDNKVVTYNEDIFKIFNKFTNLGQLYVSHILIPSIPASAFAVGPETLTHFRCFNAGVKKIGDHAFTGLKNLKVLDLARNKINVEEISVKAFEGINPAATLDLIYNPLLTYLPENKFKSFLDTTTATLRVGFYGSGDDIENSLHCDKRADWICSNSLVYKKKLLGFQCKEKEYKDVWNYCNGEKDSENKTDAPDSSSSITRAVSAIVLMSGIIFSLST